VARRSIYFHRRLRDLGPTYLGCPTDCTRPARDQDDDCRRCEYKIQWAAFLKECREEIAVKSPGPVADEKWPVETVLDQLDFVTSLDSEVGGRVIRPRWTFLTALLVKVYRGELGKARAIDAWEREQEAEERRREYEQNWGSGRRGR
jgi:hypothetical protein